MSAPNPRKRAAPGASPIVPVSRGMQQQFKADQGAAGNPMMQWAGGNGDAVNYLDTTGNGDNAFGLAQVQAQFSQAVATPSNTLTRRQMNRALVSTNPRPNFDNSQAWPSYGNDNTLVPQNGGEVSEEQESVEMLEEMAQKAKREAQTKRKQIYPFVQKLSSFLEERKNEDLIRWSEKGNSFVVLDEDEFAKTLIPELFKHNNYASFVRQLNMYGFHKCVGLSDNSMRASERKNKSPSEYSNPYFRRGHPNLLWLINKPKTGGKSKKGGKNVEGDVDSEEDMVPDDLTGQQGLSASANVGGRSLPAGPADTQPLPKKEMALIREELHRVREQQKLILGAINRLQRNNNDLYNQALMFQNQHDRHQNSINAILNFLANVFRKTLEDQGNTQNVGDILTSMITNQGQQTPQGNIVDLGDFFQETAAASNVLSGPSPKRARGLLPPIPNQNDLVVQPSRSQSSGNSSYRPVTSLDPEIGHITELLDTSPADSTPSLQQELESNPQERMMRIINDHNATNTSGLDLPEATELVNKTPNTLSNDQRTQLVSLMAGQTPSSTSSIPNNAAADTPMNTTSAPRNPTVSPSPGDTTVAPSLSPILRSPTMPGPSLDHISNNQTDLDQLERLQREQDAKISELSGILGPLSPSGHIPGLDSENNDTYFDAPNVDLDQYFDSSAFLNDANFGDGSDFNFNLDGVGLDAVDGVPSPTGTEEIQREDFAADDVSSHDNKRRRVG